AAPNDAPFGHDVRLRRVSGTHHIILRQSRKTSLFAKRTASLARRANITFSGRLAHKRPACTDMRQKTD
ncbi:MAG: hypothetical protein ACOYJY_05845, partial [Acutalibacteraceae bacterium]